MSGRRQFLKNGLYAAGAAGLWRGATPLTQAASPATGPGEDAYVARLVDPERLRGVEDVHLIGDLAYLPCREGQRLTIVSVADPAQPHVLGSFTHPDLDQAAGFALQGHTAFVGSHRNHRLLCVDVTDPARMALLGQVQLGGADGPGALYKVVHRDGFCYVAVQQAKSLYVVDVREPAAPVVVGKVQVTQDDDGPFSVHLRGQYALVGTVFGKTANRLAVVDVSNPRDPRLATFLAHPAVSQATGQFVGNRLVTASWERNAVVVFNLEDPLRPAIEGVLQDERLGKPNRLAMAGTLAYMPMVSGDGVAVADIADPARPRFVTRFNDPVILKKTYGIAARGDLLFVGAREGNSLSVMRRHSL